MSKHSKAGKISIFSIIIALITLICLRILDALSSSYLAKFTRFEILVKFLGIIFLLALAICLIFTIVALLQREKNKMLPAISISVLSVGFLLVYFMIFTPFYHVDSVTIANYGIFEIPSITPRDGNSRRLYEQGVLIANTDTIPAELGTSFGMNYVVTGKPKGRRLKTKWIINYPPAGFHTAEGKILADTLQSYDSINNLSWILFDFDHEHELVPGNWEFQFLYKDKIILSKEFYVVNGYE